jgi:hypothetical protein
MFGLFAAYGAGCSLLVCVSVIDNLRWHPPFSLMVYDLGPSRYSIQETLLPVLKWTVWLPALLIFCAAVVLKLMHVNVRSLGLAVLLITSSVVATAWIVFLCYLGEFVREDTIWADGFSRSKWKQIHVGMEKATVYSLVGEPLPVPTQQRDRFRKEGVTPELWATHRIAGYRAPIWFTNDVVMKIEIYFMD